MSKTAQPLISEPTTQQFILRQSSKEGAAIAALRGWIVVVAVFLTHGVLLGSTWALGAIALQLQDPLGLSREGIGLIMGLAFGGIYLGAPISGALADRFGTRAVCIAGMAVLSATFYLGSLATEAWQAIVAFGGGIGLAIGLVYSPGISAIQTWFSARRALATGVASCGLGIGALVIVPWVEAVASASGWQQAVASLAVLSAATGLMATPWISMAPDAGPSGKRFAAKVALRDLILTRRFLLLGGSTALGGFIILSAMAHMAASAVDRGIGSAEAASLVALAGIASIPARVLAGALGDRFGRTRVLAATYFGLSASYALWFVADGLWLFWAFAIVYGAANGASVVMRPAATADYYEGPRLASMIGVTFLTSFAGAVAGPLLFGLGHDVFGSYEAAQLVAVAIGLTTAVMVLQLDRETREQSVRPTKARTA